MMDKQTRAIREARELEKANLSLYLSIVNSKPSLTKVQKLREKEANRTKLVSLLSRRTSNATRIKNMADSLLR